jgi:hypothetical protein
MEGGGFVDHHLLQQQKMVAFASGLQARLCAASCVSSLNELVLVIIADEVLHDANAMAANQSRSPEQIAAIAFELAMVRLPSSHTFFVCVACCNVRLTNYALFAVCS